MCSLLSKLLCLKQLRPALTYGDEQEDLPEILCNEWGCCHVLFIIADLAAVKPSIGFRPVVYLEALKRIQIRCGSSN